MLLHTVFKYLDLSDNQLFIINMITRSDIYFSSLELPTFPYML